METKINNIVSLLNELKISTNLTFNTELRHSWYVDKIIELGLNPQNVNHIELSCGGFIAELSNGLLCTGGNIMLVDALSEIGYEQGFDYPFDLFGNIENINLYLDDVNDCNDVLITFTFESLQEYIKKIQNNLVK